MSALAFPFTCIPDAAIWQVGISALAKCLFNALLACRNRRTGLCNPKLATLAARLGRSLRTIKRALAELYQAGMVVARRNLWGNRYEIATPDRWQRPGSSAAAEDSFVPNMAQAQVPNAAPHSCHPRPHKEPDVLEPEGQQRMLLLSPPPPREAATTTPPVSGGSIEPTQAPPAPSATAAEDHEAANLVAELMPHHPWQANRPKAIEEIRKVLQQDPGAGEQLRRSHIAFRPHWELQYSVSPRAFKIPLWQWVQEGNWRTVPAAPSERKEAKRETMLERQQRKDRERQELQDARDRGWAERGAWDILRAFAGDEAVEVWRARIAAESKAEVA